MAGKKKHLCQWSQQRILAKLDRLSALVGRPRFVCQNCARAAREKQVLCRPVRLAPAAEDPAD